jgi:hypothetical protein
MALAEAERMSEPLNNLHAADFWDMTPSQRKPVLLDAISEAHTWHYDRNPAYRRLVKSRGVGPQLDGPEFARVLRPTSQAFKSYISVIGTPFPQERPAAFMEWVADQLSVPLPRERFEQFESSYSSLEKLLQDFETVFEDFGFEVTTSSGTSGRATIMVRDRETVDLAVDCFVQATLAFMGVGSEHNAIFMMPRQTRIAMARTARFGTERLGMQDEGRVHFTIPFPADPDRVRIRAGRTFQPGWQGTIEKRFSHRIARWMDEHYVQPRAIAQTIDLLREAERSRVPTLLFGSLTQLHALSQKLQSQEYGTNGRPICLPTGSLVGTGGGLKELYPYAPDRIRQDIQAVLLLEDGEPIPVRDVMGMAEANWAAPQCPQGNYHLPPWVYVLALDDDDEILVGSDVEGLLGFLDPVGSGRLFPSFFKTTDQVRLVNGTDHYDPALRCPCGHDTPYLVQGTIRRVDLLEEAGCAGQL